MKRWISILVCLVLVLGLAACGSNTGSKEPATDKAEATTQKAAAETETQEPAAQEATTQEPAAQEADQEEPQTGKDVLVVYFSATGTTKAVAEKIAAITDADIYEITPAQEYTSEDLDWNDDNSRSTKEQNDPDARPEIGSETISLEGYSRIYIGYPIWWGEEPRIMDTFVESYSFDGITMIPFCTSASSGIGSSGDNLADHAGSGDWLDGQRFGSGASEDEIASWIDELQ